MAFQVKKSASGLLNNVNKFNAPPGAFSVLDNVMINADEQVDRRPSFDSCSSGLPAAKPQRLFVHNGQLYCHIDSSLYVKDSSCNWTRINGFGPTFGFFWDLFLVSNMLYVNSGSGLRVVNLDTNASKLTAGNSTLTFGYADGPGYSALFRGIVGMWSDGTYMYFNDAGYTLRRITLTYPYTVTTLAGLDSTSGGADGVGAAARFAICNGMVGNPNTGLIYICDQNTIRSYNIATGAVVTIAGTFGMSALTDGVGAAARFVRPNNCAIDTVNNILYVSDSDSTTAAAIRKIELGTNTVTTIAGAAAIGYVNANGTSARFKSPTYLQLIGTNLYIADNNNYMLRLLNLATMDVTQYAGRTTANNPGVDGPRLIAEFGFAGPGGITYDSVNNILYLGDRDNHKIRFLSFNDQNVYTYLGDYDYPFNFDGISYTYFDGPT